MQIKYQIERVESWTTGAFLAVHWHSIPREMTLGRLWGNLLTNLTTIPLANSCVNVQNCSSFRENHRSYEKEAWKKRSGLPGFKYRCGALNNRPFPSSPGPLFQSSTFDMEIIFILVQVKLIFTRKVVHQASFWKWGFLELGSGLLS